MRKRDTSKYHIQLCVALLLMLIVSLALIATGSQAMHMVYAGCVSISVLVHYFALVAVMWMGAEALLMFQKVVIIFIRVSKKYIIAVSLICWCKFYIQEMSIITLTNYFELFVNLCVVYSGS